MSLDVDLWFWRLDQPERRVEALARHLSADEAARAARFVHGGNAGRYRVGRGRLREILAGYLGGDPAALRFDYSRHHRPSLAGGPAFNLSHAGGWAALAVTRAEVPVGIDIEAARRVERDVARRFFSDAENAALEGLDKESWADGFFRAWTRKEAILKATGDGLTLPLAQFDVTLDPGLPARLLASRTPALRARDWHLTHLDIGPGFVGCLAVASGGAAPAWHLREGDLPLAAV